MSNLSPVSRLKWRAGGSLIVASPCLFYSVDSFRAGDILIGGIVFCAGALLVALYLTMVCLVFEDDFIEMGIVPGFMLSIGCIILLPLFVRWWQMAHR